MGLLRYSHWYRVRKAGGRGLEVRCLRSGARGDAVQLHPLVPLGQESGAPLTGEGWDGELSQLVVEEVWGDGVEFQTEVHKQDSCIQSR